MSNRRAADLLGHRPHPAHVARSTHRHGDALGAAHDVGSEHRQHGDQVIGASPVRIDRAPLDETVTFVA
jgi:hypothetical protein